MLSLIFFFNFYNINTTVFNNKNIKVNNNKNTLLTSTSLYYSFFLKKKKFFFNSIADFFLFKKTLDLREFYNLYNDFVYTKKYILSNYDFFIDISFKDVIYDFNKINNNYKKNNNEIDDLNLQNYITFFFPKNYFINGANLVDKSNVLQILPHFREGLHLKKLNYVNNYINYMNISGNINSFLKFFLKIDTSHYIYNNKICIYINNSNLASDQTYLFKIGDFIKVSFSCLSLRIYYDKLYNDCSIFFNKYFKYETFLNNNILKSNSVDDNFDFMFFFKKNNDKQPYYNNFYKKFSKDLNLNYYTFILKNFEVSYCNNIYVCIYHRHMLKFNFFLKNFINLYSFRLYSWDR